MSSATRVDGRRPHSIFTTIIVLMTLSMSVLFVGFAGFNLWATAEAQRRDHEQYITTTLHFVRAELEGRLEEGESEETELAEIEDVVLRENASRRFGHVELEITGTDGTPLLATEGIERVLKESPPFPPPPRTPADATIVYWESSSGLHYVLSGFQSTSSSEGVRHVRIALDWTDAARKAAAYRRRSLSVAFLCTILASFAAAFVTRHALRPLMVIRDAADSIRKGSFDARLEPDRLPPEIGNLAKSFRRMQEHLQDSFERLTQFSAELAHELRTPINNLMGENEVALSKNRTSEEYRELLGSNLEEMDRLSRMIDRLLFLARASRGATLVEAELLDLGVEADSVAEYHRPHAEELGVTITREGTASLSADRTLLRRAISNLLSNALEASREGDRISMMISESSDLARIAVRDEGSGIEAHDLPHVFERFHRSREARSRRPEGNGLGLAIVRSVVELHRGRVSIDSQPGVGTVVTLAFPRTMTET